MDTLPGLPCVILIDAFLNLVRYDICVQKICHCRDKEKKQNYVVRCTLNVSNDQIHYYFMD